MYSFHFYSTCTSAIQTLEKKNDIIISLSGFLHLTESLNRSVGLVFMHVNRKYAHSVLHTSSQFLSFFCWKCHLHWSAYLCRYWQGVSLSIRQLKSINRVPIAALMTVYMSLVQIKGCFWYHLGSWGNTSSSMINF